MKLPPDYFTPIKQSRGRLESKLKTAMKLSKTAKNR
jgi:hypothetical protein